MKKHKLMLRFITFIMFLSLYGCGESKNQGKTNTNKPEDVYVNAKTDGYTSIEELEKSSDLIVIGTKLKEIESNVEYDEHGIFQIAYTYSNFKINKIVQNNINETSTEITIFENQAYDERENRILHIAGYVNMIKGNQYILYLKKSDDNYFIPLAVTAGKIPLSNSEINKSTLKMKNSNNEVVESNKVIEELHQQVQEKYKDYIK